MTENYQHSKEGIKNRMLKRIATLWEIRSTENLDPIVKLLIESLASEIFKLLGELGSMENRLLSKLATAMTPTAMLTARPAHAILYAKPIETDYVLTNKTFLTYRSPVHAKRYNLNKIDFLPLVPCRITKSEIKYLAVENTFYQIGKRHEKISMGHASRVDEELNRSVWIGMEVDEELPELENVSFYFDFTHIDHKVPYLKLLPHTVWSKDGERLTTREGLHKANDSEDSDGGFISSSEPDRVSKDLLSWYDNHYVTLTDRIETTNEAKKVFPAELTPYYTPEFTARFTKPMVWINVKFPLLFSRDVLDSLHVSLNSVPVVNKTLRQETQVMEEVSTYMALRTESHEYFLKVAAVEDTSGKVYEEFVQNESSFALEKRGIYSLRKGGAEQFNADDAKNYLVRLTDILRDESVAFSGTNKEELRGSANEILFYVNQMQQKTNKSKGKPELDSYIIVDKATPDETLMVGYWVTNAALVNQIKAGTPLIPDTNVDLLAEEMYLLTATKGGEEAPNVSQISDIYRYNLISRDAVFSREDIANFCKSEYGRIIKDVEVRSGYGVGQKPNEGIVRTTDLYLDLYEQSSGQLKDLELKDNLLCKLMRRAPDNFRFRIFINE